MSMRSFEDQIWRDYNGPLWLAVQEIARLCGEITEQHLARRLAA
jgi:hypothetical protein